MKALKSIFFILFFVLICSEQILFFLPNFDSKSLAGAYSIPNKPKLTLPNWFNNKFQDSLINYFEFNLKLHNLYVRSNNQINFNLFNQSAAKMVLVGKHHQIFEDYYIDSYIGKDYLGVDTIKKRTLVLAELQKELANKNITLVTLIAPAKSSIYPQDIPNNYPGLEKKTTTNYDTYIKEFKHQKINFIDFRNYFLQIKNKVNHPLFSNLGTHWNGFGSSLAADSLIHYLEKIRNIDMVDCVIEKGYTSQEPKYYDNDLMDLLNLMYKLPCGQLYYPNIKFKDDQSKYKPKAILIGDSFSWAWIHTYPFFQNIFDKDSEFWYYNNVIYFANNGAYAADKIVDSSTLSEKIKNQDFIILLFNEHNLFEFDFNVSKNLKHAMKENSLQ
jgi:hypothetical protein